jgi:hypothetical protein
LSTVDGVRAVTSLSDDFEVWLRVEDEPQALTDNGVIVGQQDAGLELGYEGTSPAPKATAPRG